MSVSPHSDVPHPDEAGHPGSAETRADTSDEGADEGADEGPGDSGAAATAHSGVDVSERDGADEHGGADERYGGAKHDGVSQNDTAAECDGPDPDGAQSGDEQDRADEFERKLTVPVLIAALASIPAVFLTRAGGAAAAIGTVLNWASVAVLIGESVGLLWLEGSVRRWLQRYRWQLLVVAAAVPAVVFVIGPLQVLRLVLLLGGFHILRARRIVNAGRVVVERLGLGQRRARWVLAVVVVLAGAFSLIVLADPESRSRHVVDWFVERVGVPGTVLAGVAVAGVIYAAGRLLTRIRG